MPLFKEPFFKSAENVVVVADPRHVESGVAIERLLGRPDLGDDVETFRVSARYRQ